MPEEVVYTAEDLLCDARAQGTPTKQRLITDWVSKGLLDRPARHSLGQGLGSEKGTWPENQQQLFLVLLRNREEVRRIATLCNVPVALWLYEGPGLVPTRQARLALATYAGANRTASKRAALQSARLVSEQLIPPDLPRRERVRLLGRLEKEIESVSRGDPLNYEQLIEAARDAFDPDRTGRAMGPPKARLTPEAWAGTVRARILAIASLDPREERPNNRGLEEARLAHLHARLQYREQHVEFARDPDVGSMFEAPTLNAVVNHACLEFLTVLGFLEISKRDGGAPDPPL